RYVDLPIGEDAISQRRRDHVWQSLRESSLFFSHPSSFNDPFDCRSLITTEAPAEDVRKFWRSSNAYGAQADHAAREARVEEMVREAGTPTGDERALESARQVIAGVGIACVCEREDSILMWSYYAGGHRGLCLRID